jgi:hypothetical protein
MSSGRLESTVTYGVQPRRANTRDMADGGWRHELREKRAGSLPGCMVGLKDAA